MKQYLFLIIILLNSFYLFSQNQQNNDSLKHPDYYQTIDIEDFNSKLLQQIIEDEINAVRTKQEMDSLKRNVILQNAAEDQSEYMAAKDMTTDLQGGKKKTVGKRIEYYGGSNNGAEIVTKMSPKKGKFILSYKQLAQDIMFRFLKSKKTSIYIINPVYVFCGIGAELNDAGKKVYVSVVFGNYDSFNNGAERRDEMDVPFSTKKYGLKHRDEKICSKTKKFKNLSSLQESLYIEQGKIYFQYNNLKALRKLIKDSKDGLAVDIVQKVQFGCTGDNIMDNTLVNRGIMQKRLYANKLYKKNLITDDKQRKTRIKVLLGTIPPDLDGEYEINLMIIKQKHVCKECTPIAHLEGAVEYNKELDLLADTVQTDAESYTPKPEKNVLTFKIPFEKNKFEYQKEDIEPFIKKLKEPDFIIEKLKITAYSSIEGNDANNKQLQEKRAKSIVSALSQRQKTEIKPEIVTGYSWDDFKRDLAGTEYNNLTCMSMTQAQQYIKEHGLSKKLEPYLKNERYGTIELSVSYEIEGDKEQQYVVNRFNKAVKNNNKELALSIQKFIFKKVLADEYDSLAVSNQEIPMNSGMAGLYMNKLWLQKYVRSDFLDESYCKKIDALSHLVPDNYYLKFNSIYCKIHNKLSYADETEIIEYQRLIDALYETSMSKETIDLLNLEFQINVIQAIDTTDTPTPLVKEKLQKIKEIANIDQTNDDWQNAMKLSYIFVQAKDFDFAAKILEPFIY
ncbi:MAG: hypothetical protein DRP35_08895, partial [Candidatus Zixiibacteriota bacterium]